MKLQPLAAWLLFAPASLASAGSAECSGLSASARQPAKPSSSAEPDVAALYARKCAACHGDDGKGQTKLGRRFHAPDFSAPDWQKEAKDATLRQVIEEGVVKDGVRRMPANKGKLTPEEVDGLVRSVRALGARAKP